MCWREAPPSFRSPGWSRRMLPGVRAIIYVDKARPCAAGAEDGQRSSSSCREDLSGVPMLDASMLSFPEGGRLDGTRRE